MHKAQPTTRAPILQIENLSKSYGDFRAVDELSFSVQPGDIYGFLGQNGAGKSTTMRMMLGLVRPSSGTGAHQKEKRLPGAQLKHIGAIIERPDMYGYLSGLDNLRIFRPPQRHYTNERTAEQLAGARFPKRPGAR